jgi:Spy/CpxP family protein refolding chaperone
MKKFLMTMMAAFVMTSAAFAQENKEQAKCCEKKCEQCKCQQCKCEKGKCCEMKCSEKKDMVKFKTERTAKRYNLNEKQAAQLLELNQKYADLMKNYDTDLQKIMTPEQYKQYQEDHQKFGKRGHHGKGHGHKH